MKYLLDTNIIVDHLRARKILSEDFLVSGAGISIITLGELIYGAYKSDNPQKSLQNLENSLKILNLDIINLNFEVVSEFSRIKVGLEKKGKRLEDFDLLIAATAKVNGFILVTGNKKHFERIPDLKLD